VQSIVGKTKLIEGRKQATQCGLEPGQSIFAEPQYTQGAVERGESADLDPRQPAVVEVQPVDGHVGERSPAVERQTMVTVEEQLVEMESGEGTVTQRREAVVAEIQPAQAN